MSATDHRTGASLCNGRPLGRSYRGFLLYVALRPFIPLPRKEAVPASKKRAHFIRAEEDKSGLDIPRYDCVGAGTVRMNRGRLYPAKKSERTLAPIAMSTIPPMRSAHCPR